MRAALDWACWPSMFTLRPARLCTSLRSLLSVTYNRSNMRCTSLNIAWPTPVTDLEKVLERYSDLQHQFEHEGGFEYAAKAEAILQGLGFEREMLVAGN